MADSKKFIEFQEHVGKIKHLRRTGWVVRQVPKAETVAAHSWRMALMAIYKEKELREIGADANHIIEMCLLHDVGESVVGDIVPEIHQTGNKKISDKRKSQIEGEAINSLAEKYDFPKLKTSFEEYEAQGTLEAKVVKNIDKLDMLLQAYEYIVAYPYLKRLDEFMTFNEKAVDLPLFSVELQEIKLRQSENKQRKNKFIDDSILAGLSKHQLYNPTGADISDYDTIAAHLFRTALMAVYLGYDIDMIKSIVSNSSDEQIISELAMLENIQQAYEYTKLYPDVKCLKSYIQQNKNKVIIPSLRKLIAE